MLIDDPQAGAAEFNGDGLASVAEAAWMRWRATWMPPQLAWVL